jgi:hypothetical protein
MILGDISNANNTLDLIQIFTAVLIVDFIVILIVKKGRRLGKVINVWYDELGMTAVMLDVFILVIGIIITRYIFTYFKIPFNVTYFILIALGVQLIHDILLYLLVIVPSNKGVSQVVDIYKDYADENGAKILLADSMMVLASCLIAMLLKQQDNHVSISLMILVIYLIPYYVYSK